MRSRFGRVAIAGRQPPEQTPASSTAMPERCRRRASASPEACSASLRLVSGTSGAVTLLTAGPPRAGRRDCRHVRAPQHVVERGKVAVHHLAQLSLRRLEAILQILLHRQLLAGRLEVAVLQAVGQVAELLHELRAEANAVLSAAGRAQLDELPFGRRELLVEIVRGLPQLGVLNQVLQVVNL